MLKVEEQTPLDGEVRKNVQQWLEGPFDEETKKEIRRLMEEDPTSLSDAFYTKLNFGTGGLRGVMGVGCNRMNRYTVRFATQGLANYLKQNSGSENLSVIIGYDCRHHSQEFGLEAARVLAGNGIRAFIFKELRPTPLVSFGCREKKCNAALMITASHNPPEYNGYKVYWNDGGQVLPPHDRKIISEAEKITSMDQVNLAEKDNSLIEWIDQELDDQYYNTIQSLQCCAQQNQEYGGELKIVYTSLHGTGITMVPQALQSWGFSQVSVVKEQADPNGDFPTVASPNPEEAAALEMGIQYMRKGGADLVLGNDPDTDRMGAVVFHQGKEVLLTGNQIACLCQEHLCRELQEQGRLESNAAFVKTIVTSELFSVIAHAYGKTCENVLPGFKYIAEKILEWESDPSGKRFLFGGEESYGYLLGTHARDKDAVIASLLLCEVALAAKLQGKTLVDRLHEIYETYGVFREGLCSLRFPETRKGREQMKSAMVRLRENPPREINGSKVCRFEDYLEGVSVDVFKGTRSSLTLPQSNVLCFWLEDETKIVVRPSGTEPKVKLYCGVSLLDSSNILEEIQECDERVDNILEAVEKLLQ